MIARIFAALIPGYILANSSAILIGFLLPMPKPDAALAVSMLSFALYTAIIMWVFHVPSMKKLWLTLLLAILGTGGASWLLYQLAAGVTV